MANLPGWFQVASVVGVILILGLSIGEEVSDIRSLPAVMDTIKAEHLEFDEEFREIDHSQNRLERKIDRLLCFSEAERGDRTYEDCGRI